MRTTLKSYVFWTHPRGSLHYDVMVTLILAFIFLSPRLINYRERPQETLTSANGVLVKTNGANAFTYEIGEGMVGETGSGTELKAQLLTRIRAISGDVQLDRYTVQKDAAGHVLNYRVWAHR